MNGIRTFLIGALMTAAVAAPINVRAQAAAVRSVDSLFADAAAKEAAVRKVLDAPSPSPSVLKAVRTVVTDFENVVKRYPASGYCDDALWRAAMLSRSAFETFHDVRDHTTAIRLLKALRARYPSSKFVKSVPAQLSALNAMASEAWASTPLPEDPAARSPTPSVPIAAPASTPLAPGPSPPEAAAAPAKIATIREIRRAVMPDAVRIVIELDGEVAFRDERLENPARVFVDLPATRAAPTLQDQTLRFDTDGGPVRQVRIGRHPNATTRVVLETAGISSYSVYPLYRPFRLVIDCLEAKPVTGTVTRTPTPEPPLTPAAVSLAAPVIAGRTLPPLRVPTIEPRDLRPPLTARRRTLPQAKVPSVVPIAPATFRAAAAPPPALPNPTTKAVARVEEPHAPVGTVSIAQLPAPAITEPSKTLAGGYSIARQLGLSVSRIVIDPGHGGHDPGAKSGGTTEAALVLDIALKLEAQLSKLPGVEVVLTRRTDAFVSLQERTAIANRESADLFLSIHANASSSAQTRGVETYFLNFATTQSAAAVAARENAASGQAMNELPDVVKAIALNNKRDESRDFATYVQREMVGNLKPANKLLKDLGVKQAPFVVLIGAAMPSALAEVSFLTNAQDARLLKSSQYRQRIANALFDAVRKYQAALKSPPRAVGQN